MAWGLAPPVASRLAVMDLQLLPGDVTGDIFQLNERAATVHWGL